MESRSSISPVRRAEEQLAKKRTDGRVEKEVAREGGKEGKG